MSYSNITLSWKKGSGLPIKLQDLLQVLRDHVISVFGHQTWQDDNLHWWTLVHKVIWSINHMVLWDHMATQNHYISTTTMPITTKLASCRLVIKGFQQYCYSTVWSGGITCGKVCQFLFWLKCFSKASRNLLHFDKWRTVIYDFVCV